MYALPLYPVRCRYENLIGMMIRQLGVDFDREMETRQLLAPAAMALMRIEQTSSRSVMLWKEQITSSFGSIYWLSARATRLLRLVITFAEVPSEGSMETTSLKPSSTSSDDATDGSEDAMR